VTEPDRWAVVDFDAVLKEELTLISRRRRAGGLPAPEVADTQPQAVFDAGLVGLALSGGGIRSACFNLGLLQALGKRGVLHRTDYLSTVSGGGYIGSCLSSLCADPWADVRPGPSFPFWFDGVNESRVVKHLRQHGQYLGVDGGVLRLRTWQAMSAYLGGLAVTLLSVAALLAVFAGLAIGLFPWGVYLVERVYGTGHAVALADAQLVLAKPSQHAFALFLPGLVAFAAWLASGLVYAVANLRPALWTLGLRAALARVQSVLLAAAAALLVGGALPFVLVAANRVMHDLRPVVTSAWLASLLSLAGIMRASENVRGTLSRLRIAQRWLVAAGASLLVTLVLLTVLYLVWLQWARAGWIALGALLLLVLLAGVTDINRFSMFYFYRDRLSEAFVVRRRSPDAPVERNDGLAMSDLAFLDRRVPYHLVNTCVNLPGSRNPALRDRRADFFLLSPLYCGCPSMGYRRTHRYEDNRISLASALAVSGAAANPQFGAKSRPALAFLLTMLNARLGVWAQNPGAAPRRYLPEFAPHAEWPVFLFAELLSLADEEYSLVNVSDGGHIENLGVYELLRRRCRVIIASDASADPAFAFDDLANAIRKARIDLGIEIVMDLTAIRERRDHVVVGRVLYPVANDEHPHQGWFIYVKSVLAPGDPIDLHEYRTHQPDFPHESTADQFFDEAQFESYRQLGYRSGRAMCEAAARAGVEGLGLDALAAQLLARHTTQAATP
jgi:hypothetical protein